MIGLIAWHSGIAPRLWGPLTAGALRRPEVLGSGLAPGWASYLIGRTRGHEKGESYGVALSCKSWKIHLLVEFSPRWLTIVSTGMKWVRSRAHEGTRSLVPPDTYRCHICWSRISPCVIYSDILCLIQHSQLHLRHFSTDLRVLPGDDGDDATWLEHLERRRHPPHHLLPLAIDGHP